MGRQEFSEFRCESGLAAEPACASIDQLSVRKELLTNPRADTICGYEHVPNSVCPIGETGTDGSIGLLLVSGELFAKVYDLLKPDKENLAQRQAIHSRADGDELAAVGRWEMPGGKLFELTIDDRKDGSTLAWLTASSQNKLVQVGWQALTQCLFTTSVQVEAIALAAGRRGRITLIDRNTNSCLEQTLGETEATKTSSDHKNLQRRVSLRHVMFPFSEKSCQQAR